MLTTDSLYFYGTVRLRIAPVAANHPRRRLALNPQFRRPFAITFITHGSRIMGIQIDESLDSSLSVDPDAFRI